MQLFKNILQPIAAYANDHFIVTDYNPNIRNVRFRLRIWDPEISDYKTITEQFASPFNQQTVFTIKGVLGSLMSDYTNPFEYVDGGCNLIPPIDNKMSLRPLVGWREIMPDGSIGDFILETNYTIYKAAHTGENIIWKRIGDPIHGFANERTDNEIVRYCYANDKIFLTVLYSQLGSPGDRPDFDIYLNDTKIGESGSIADARRRRDFVIDLSEYSLPTINELRIVDPDTTENYPGTVNYKFILDKNCYPRKKTLYFLNDFGGWEHYNFIDYSVKETVDKDQYTTYKDIYGSTSIGETVYHGQTEMTLFGRQLIAEGCNYLKHVLTSPIVLDEKGIRVRVTTSNLRLDEQGIIEPTVTIKYEKQDKIKN